MRYSDQDISRIIETYYQEPDLDDDDEYLCEICDDIALIERIPGHFICEVCLANKEMAGEI